MRLSAAIFTIAFSASGQTVSKAEIVAGVKEVHRALLYNRFDRVVELTHPKLVQLMGGREAMIADLRKGAVEMAAKHISLGDMSIATPWNPVRGGSDIYVVVPSKMVILAPNGRLIRDCYEVAISSDDGSTWKYIDASVQPVEKLKLVLPQWPAGLRIPQISPPVFRPD